MNVEAAFLEYWFDEGFFVFAGTKPDCRVAFTMSVNSGASKLVLSIGMSFGIVEEGLTMPMMSYLVAVAGVHFTNRASTSALDCRSSKTLCSANETVVYDVFQQR